MDPGAGIASEGWVWSQPRRLTLELDFSDQSKSSSSRVWQLSFVWHCKSKFSLTKVAERDGAGDGIECAEGGGEVEGR